MDYKAQSEALKNLETIAYGYNINGEVFGMDCSDFEQIMVDAADSITDLLSRAEVAEARAEKAEMERDALLKEFAGECGVCLHYEECSKNHYSCFDGADWEWSGQKEE